MNGNGRQSADATAKIPQTQAKDKDKEKDRERESAISKVFKGRKNNLLIVLGLCAGVLFIVLSFIIPGKSNTYNGDNNANVNADFKIEFTRTDTETYIRGLENKLCEALKRVKGISEPYVMITIESSSEYIYATKEHIKENSSVNGGNSTSQKEVQSDVILYSDVQKEESPILVKEIQPKIKGVAVVCKGIDDSETQLRIINLVSTVLNLPTNRVYVAGAD